MKKILLIAALGFHLTANAQFSAGVKLDLGFGGISSSNLEKNLDYQRSYNPKITDWTVNNRWGLDIGFGAFAAYNFSESLSLRAEPGFDFLKCGIDFTRTEDKRDASGDGDIKTESTVSDIDVSYFNLPLLLRYSFQSKFFLQAGIGIYFPGTPSITTAGASQKDYKNGALEKTTISPLQTLQTELDVFSSPRYNFVFGVGKSFEVGGKELAIDLRYNLPLTKSEMYTTDGKYNDGRFEHNDLLGLKGKTDAEMNAPYPLNDFKMNVISLSVSYSLTKK